MANIQPGYVKTPFQSKQKVLKTANQKLLNN